VFVYGSVARGDTLETGNIEVGVVTDTVRLRRATLAAATSPGVRLCPFTVDELTSATPDVPFPKRMFTAELASYALTIGGSQIVEFLPRPALHAADLMDVVRFTLGTLVGVLEPLRNECVSAASPMVVNAGFVAARVRVAADVGRLVFVRRPELYELSDPLHTAKMRAMLDRCAAVHLDAPFDMQLLFDVIGVLDRVCLVELSVLDPKKILIPRRD
jgi:hypothetical protein